MLPSVASINSYGGPLKDYSPPRDASVDRPANGTNPAYGDTAAMTHTALRAWVRFTPAGTGSPALTGATTWDATWNNSQGNAAPAPARSSIGVYTLTFPATVFDEIPPGQPGATASGFAVNLRAGWANVEPGGATNYEARVVITAPNVATVKIFAVGTSTPVDPSDGTAIGVFLL